MAFQPTKNKKITRNRVWPPKIYSLREIQLGNFMRKNIKFYSFFMILLTAHQAHQAHQAFPIETAPTTPPRRSSEAEVQSIYENFYAVDYIGLNEMTFDSEKDLLYGLKEARKPTIANLNGKSKIRGLTADYFNNILIEYLEETNGKNPYKSSKDVSTYWDDFEIEALANETIKKNKMNECEKEKFKAYAQFFREKVLLPKFDSPHPSYINPFDENEQISAGCLGAIEHISIRGGKIHFILDGLKMEESLKVKEGYDAPFTPRELKQVFKLWITSPKILDSVKFYKNRCRLDFPPWLEIDSKKRTQCLREDWKTYAGIANKVALSVEVCSQPKRKFEEISFDEADPSKNRYAPCDYDCFVDSYSLKF